jgi:CDP-diacylglycerol--glycerol-3-phosphate 3-phosphatidyltransferase
MQRRAYSIDRLPPKQASTATVYLLKSGFQAWLRPVAGMLAKTGLTANQVTLFTCFSSMGFGLIVTFRPSRPVFLLLPVSLFVRMALNAIDGILALEFGQGSRLGVYLNELGDVISDLFLYLPFVFLAGIDSWWMSVVIALSLISEMTGAVGVMTGATRRYDGPMGKSDRAVVFGALALWRGLGWPFALWAVDLFPKLMTLLLVMTMINRVRNGLAEECLND